MPPADEPLSIRLASSYRIDRFDRLLRDLQPLTQLTQPRRVVLDLGGLVSVGPSALAYLTAIVKRVDDLDLFADGSVLVVPRSHPVRNYLMRMDMLRVLDLADDLPESFDRNPAIGFRPCREFTRSEECLEVARDLTDALAERCETDDVARFSIRVCLEELAENVLHHADTPLGGFAAAQGWPRSQEFEIAIVDLGIGVRASLTKNPLYADIEADVDAITTALRPRVSSTPDRNAGIGLFVTKLLLRENGGTLVVRSGRGAVYSGAHEEAVDPPIAFPGTLVALRARIDRPLNIKDVYRRLDDGDGGEDDAETS